MSKAIKIGLVQLFFLIFNSASIMAQQQQNYSSQYKKIEEFEKKGLTKSALAESKKIFEDALKTNNEPQQIKAAMYQMKYNNLVNDESQISNIAFIETLIKQTKAPAKNILLSMQAQLINDYKENNRYKFYDRTVQIVENDKDISTWSLAKLNKTIISLYKASIANEALLKNTPTKTFDAIIIKGKNTENLRPTLYDFLAHRMLDYCSNTENDVTDASTNFIIHDEVAFGTIQQFTAHKFVTKDTASLYYKALELLQTLLKFHSTSTNNVDALLDVELKRLAFVHEHGVFTNKEKLYKQALQIFINNYAANNASAQAAYLLANALFVNDMVGNNQTNADNVLAKKLCEKAILQHPKSEGGINCQNLLNNIVQPILHVEVEKVNLPNKPFRCLVNFKNSDTIYYRVVKTTRDELNSFQNLNSESQAKAILAFTPLKTVVQQLPITSDYRKHSVEIKIDDLPVGSYLIIASLHKKFELKNNIISYVNTYVSNISYINNNKNELYVLHRETGKPIEAAYVQVYKNEYNNRTSTYQEKKEGLYSTDKNGFVKIKSENNNNGNTFLQIKVADDELFMNDNFYNYTYNSEQLENIAKKQTFLFTDRAIYRPGQKIFFKGIVVQTLSKTKQSVIVPNSSTSVFLFDNNGQKQGVVQVKTNAYGSYNGSFTLPDGLLNGDFYLQDSITKSTYYISVEEYKRPKFLVDINKPKASYRVNDSVKITGMAKAFAGNNIDGAKVSYRVVRVVRYPIWWWGGYGKYVPNRNSSPVEITNGITTTDTKGEFNILFNAIPDEAIEIASQPTFDYDVIADVTDINGETRSSTVRVSISYQAIEINITGPQKLDADSIKNIGITTLNTNGIHQKTSVQVSLFKLIEPNRIVNKRYWDKPDMFIMNKQEFYKNFPYDVYDDEDEMNKWPLGNAVLSKTDTTAANATFNLKATTSLLGWYKLVVTGIDVFGQPVKAEKFIQFTTDKATAVVNNSPIQINTATTTAEPNQKIKYNISTGFNKIYLVQNIVSVHDTYKITYPTVSVGEVLNNTIDVTEADRGGILLSYAFVQNNRFYTGQQNFYIPYTNKELNISYETFRNKLEPGSNEKWKVKITGKNAEKISAETLIRMYDASLDQYKTNPWQNLGSLYPSVYSNIRWYDYTFIKIESNEQQSFANLYKEPKQIIYDALLENGWSEESNSLYWMNNNSYSYSDVGSVGRTEIQTETAPRHMKMASPNAISQVQFAAPKMNNGENEVSDSTTGKIKNPVTNSNITVRKNFNETAFFFPDLVTDEEGNVSFSFTMPEALTQWKLQVLAHTKELASAVSTNTTITQKELMVQPNAPRFLREGDRMEFSAKIVNITEKEITGNTVLELFDAANNKTVDGWFKNIFAQQFFTVAAGQSVLVKFPIDVPLNFNAALLYRIKAVAGNFSDGEEAPIPVLTNRMLVTETLPLNMRNETKKDFRFEKLLAGTPATATNQGLTIEYTSNPAWYAVQALPYLMEYPYECAEQSFNRFYANTLAAHICNSSPKIKQVFERWKITDTAALMSNLQKNEELKSVLLQETPWVLQAQNEAQQKKNIALLFDMVRLASEKNKTLSTLKELQTTSGAFAWFKGGNNDRYITQYILTGIGHLIKLKALQPVDVEAMQPILTKALPYVDDEIKKEYENLLKFKSNLKQNNLSASALQYLYMRSFFSGNKISTSAQLAVNYYTAQANQYWVSQQKYGQAMIALALFRNGNTKTPKAIIQSLQQNSMESDEMGMYFKEFTKGGYYWYQAPIESQALVIEAFTDIDGNEATINNLKTWLLKQKQTQQWPTTKATAEACYALLYSPNASMSILNNDNVVQISVGNAIKFSSTANDAEASTGYIKKRIEGDKVTPQMGNISIELQSTTNQPINKSTSYGAAYWQYFQDIDKITAAETALKLNKKLFLQKNTSAGPVLQPINDGDEIHVGDKIKVRIELRVDRDMEYVHMKDLRAACMEPTNVLSQYKYQGGLGYYETTKDASTNFFFGYLPKGTYVFECPMFVTHAGNYSNGITSIQCMYAPEFSSHSNGLRVTVVE